jgi:light-regulated signal transduction histidine kinase (bacteriophytochrome)
MPTDNEEWPHHSPYTQRSNTFLESMRAKNENPSQRVPSGNSRRSLDSQEGSDVLGTLSPSASDRVFPIRSVVSVDPTSTPAIRPNQQEGYFVDTRRINLPRKESPPEAVDAFVPGRAGDSAAAREDDGDHSGDPSNPGRLAPQLFSDLVAGSAVHDRSQSRADSQPSVESSVKSIAATDDGSINLITARFKHVVTEEGHAVITGRDGDVLQRCEDEPIHIPGAVQGFGLLIALHEIDGKFIVRIVSENSERIIGYPPKKLFELESFTDILSEEQADNLMDHIDFIRDEDSDVALNGPEVFTMTIRSPKRRAQKLWCAMHMNEKNPDLIICEFELEDDTLYPLVPPSEMTPDLPEDTLDSNPTAEEFAASTQNISRPLRVLRSARKRKGEAAAMEVFNILSQVQEQLASASSLEKFLKVLVGVVKELTGFHRVMIYQFDQQFNGRVVTELLDPRYTKDLYHGLNFPASDIPKQAREMYRINRVRLLYDRDQETARLVCRTIEDLETPLDLTHSYLRAMSPIHIKYLANMSVRSSMSISINAFNQLWGLISLHSYGPKGMRVAFPIRKMCRLVGDTASRNIERLSYASRLQARRLINTASTPKNPSGYIIASSEDLLKLFDADFGLLSIRDETKILGQIEQSQEALAMLEYFRLRRVTSVTCSHDITQDFPDLKYPPGFQVIAGCLIVPLSGGGNDFIVFFRKGQLKEVKWAGNPYEKFVKAGTEGYLEPRTSFKTWRETVIGRCRDWTEEEIETAAVLCLVYGKFIEVWRQKEVALQNSQLTRLLLANSAHEVRTPLNAIINYLEIALEGSLDQETRDNLAKSHSASKSLIYVINDLLDLTKTEEGGDLIKGEPFDLKATLHEATNPYTNDAKRKGIGYEVFEHPGLPNKVLGDQRKVRQAITNVTANAIKYTAQGSVKVEMYALPREEGKVDIEVAIQDTGAGMTAKALDSLFTDLEQVQSEPMNLVDPNQSDSEDKTIEDGKRTLGLGLAIVSRIVRNMNGQLRLKSEEGKGSRFVIQFPFELPDGETLESPAPPPPPSMSGVATSEPIAAQEVTLVERDSRPIGTPSGRISVTRKPSDDSMASRNSLKSMNSNTSARSDVDRLIEAIQEPHFGEGSPRSRRHSSSKRPILDQRHSYGGGHISPHRNRDGLEDQLIMPPEPSLRTMEPLTPGEESLPFSGTPVKALKMPNETGSPIVPRTMQEKDHGTVLGEVGQPSVREPLNAENMHVLVAEDDLVNSRIVKKRLEKLGHVIHLTGNGEECAGAYCDQSGLYDVVLMDMQVSLSVLGSHSVAFCFPKMRHSAHHGKAREKLDCGNLCWHFLLTCSFYLDADSRRPDIHQNDPLP